MFAKIQKFSEQDEKRDQGQKADILRASKWLCFVEAIQHLLYKDVSKSPGTTCS